MKLSTPQIPQSNYKGKKIAIVLPYFNDKFGLKLLDTTKSELIKHGVVESNISIARCYGTLESPFTCQKIALTKKVDAIIALGIVLRGDTYHFELVCNTTHQGLMQVQLATNTPIVFGILSCNTEKQVKERLSKGKEFAITALLQTKKI